MKVLRTVGMVAAVVALAATGVGAIAGTATAAAAATSATAGSIAKIATVVATAANLGAAALQKKPAAQGASTQVMIGANMPSPYIIGECYFAGVRVHHVGYGPDSSSGVKNPSLGMVDIFSVGGPVQALTGVYLDFTQTSFAGGTSGEAVGHYAGHLWIDSQLGETPEGSALTPQYAPMPDWGAGYKLSGKAAILWNARFPKDGKRYGSGFPQSGAIWQGVLTYDPREDSTYPGGSGAHRWADPSDKAAFSAAKATWSYDPNPGLHALRYALGTWERDETNTSAEYVQTFGIGLPMDAIWVEDFVELANVCEANGWSCHGILFEPGDKWDNLKNILAAGGAEPAFRNGKLGLRISAPRVSLDTIRLDDLSDGESEVPAMQGWESRLNVITPEYRSPDHKWEFVASADVELSDYLTLDGEKKHGTRRFNMVKFKDQAAQLGGYSLYESREAGPFDLPIGPRLRIYGPGDQLTLQDDLAADYGLETADCIVLRKTFDPTRMTGSLTLLTETAGKHAAILGLNGTSPPPITITPPDEIDDVAGPSRGAYTIRSRSVAYPATSDDDSITIEAFSGVLDDGRTIDFPAGEILGLASGTSFGVFWDFDTSAWVASPSPAASFMASSRYAFLFVWFTSDGGDYGGGGTAPPGYGGGELTPPMLEP